MAKKHLLDFDKKAWESWLLENNQPTFRAKQIMQWIYKKGILDPDKMHNIGKSTQELLKSLSSDLPKITSQHRSNDGTQKWLIQLSTGQHLETVYIPEANRGTLCVSSQVGCALACTFCATGLMGLNRNLKTHEIIAQMWIAKYNIGSDKITNVVFMGMGEPLMNEPNVYPAIRTLISDLGFGLSRQKVTVSTSGIVPAMLRYSEENLGSLALSLHATEDDTRSKLVPINRKYPICDLIDACKTYTKYAKNRHIMIEYLMLNKCNDTPEDAKRLVKIASQFKCKVNLIPFNPVAGIDFTASSQSRIDEFWGILKSKGVNVTIRKQRGDPIAAACGQLAGKSCDKTKRTLKGS